MPGTGGCRAQRVAWCWIVAAVMAACQAQPVAPTSAVQADRLPSVARALTVRLLYPTSDTSVAMGGSMSVIVQVLDAEGKSFGGGEAQIKVEDSLGRLMVVAPMQPGKDGVYRASSWLIPHRTTAGRWTVRATVMNGATARQAEGSFEVIPSLSETLLQKYGFWIAPPTLGGIEPSLVAERGDDRNGLVRLGGASPASHVLPEAWVEVQWRTGQADLSGPEAVRRFLLDDLGDLGFTPIRALGAAMPFSFQGRPGWLVSMRGQYAYDDVQWVVFYAPSVDKTYAIGTTVVLPPKGVNAHAIMRDTFELPAGVVAGGVAPEPLPDLLPGPRLVRPALGAGFVGETRPITLAWEPLKDLGQNEVYLVTLSTNYDEGSPSHTYTTRTPTLDVPAELLHQPNCGVFNWDVRLMRIVGTVKDGTPQLEAESYASLFFYFLWVRPPDTPAEFLPLCPNAQY